VDTLGVVTIVVLALAAGMAVAVPLLRGARRRPALGWDEEGDEWSGELKRLLSLKESLLDAIKEIEFDYATGKLSKDDYEELDGRYRRQAIEVLKRIDRLRERATDSGCSESASDGGEGIDAEAEVEREVLLLRRKAAARSGGTP